MKKKGGFGLVYQDVMRNENISIESKAIYGYLSSIAGVGGECYPSVETICKDLNIGKNRLSKHLSQLIALGVVERTREKNGNIYGRNVYKITHVFLKRSKAETSKSERSKAETSKVKLQIITI